MTVCVCVCFTLSNGSCQRVSLQDSVWSSLLIVSGTKWGSKGRKKWTWHENEFHRLTLVYAVKKWIMTPTKRRKAMGKAKAYRNWINRCKPDEYFTVRSVDQKMKKRMENTLAYSRNFLALIRGYVSVLSLRPCPYYSLFVHNFHPISVRHPLIHFESMGRFCIEQTRIKFCLG